MKDSTQSALFAVGLVTLFVSVIVLMVALSPNKKKHKAESPSKEAKTFRFDAGLYVVTFQVFELEGHVYLYDYRTGMLHAQHCPCLQPEE